MYSVSSKNDSAGEQHAIISVIHEPPNESILGINEQQTCWKQSVFHKVFSTKSRKKKSIPMKKVNICKI